MPEDDDDIHDIDPDMDDIDDPIPAKRDTRIFQRKKGNSDDKDDGKDEDFEEDVFV